MYNIHLLTVSSLPRSYRWLRSNRTTRAELYRSTLLLLSPYYSDWNQANQKAINNLFKLTTQDSAKNLINKPMVVYTFNPSAEEAQAGRTLILRPANSDFEQVPGQ